MNLNKCTSLFLAFLLLVSNIGFAFSVHYCGGKIASVSLDTSSSKKCCSKTIKKVPCCKDKLVKVEKNVDHATVKVFFFQMTAQAVLPEISIFEFLTIVVSQRLEKLLYYVDSNAPPLFKLYHQLLFYA